MLESLFSFWGLLAGGIRNLGFSIQAVHFPHNAEGAQYKHFHDPLVDITLCYATLSS